MHSSHEHKPIPVETEEGFNTAIEQWSVSRSEGGKRKQEQEQSCDDHIEVKSSLVEGPANKQPINLDEWSVSMMIKLKLYSHLLCPVVRAGKTNNNKFVMRSLKLKATR